MGVRGLTSFVENNRNAIYAQERLCDSNLVIDGLALLYTIYFDEVDDESLNGELLDLYKTIENFFSNLAECNISPVVVFDGPIEPSKLPCVIGRFNNSVQAVHEILTGEVSYGSLAPPFAVDTLHHYLISNGIPMVITLVDADDEVVAVANHLNCPVLSNDSDYYIYNLKGGYLPFSHFEWKQVRVHRSSGKRAIFCEKYHISIMCNQFGIHAHLLPFLSVLLGNDWIQPSVFRDLVSSFPLVMSDSHYESEKQKYYEQRMLSIFNWLALKAGNDNAVFDTLFTYLRKAWQGDLMKTVENCIAMYREPTDITETLKALGIRKTRPNDPNHTGNPRQVIRGIVRRCRAHPSAINLLDSSYVCLPVVISDTRRSSPHDVASDIRYSAYRVLLRQYRLPMVGPEHLYLQEYDRVKLTYTKLPPKSIHTSHCVMCEQRHSFEQPCVVNGEKKFVRFTTMELLQKISPKISSFCDFAKKSYAFEVPQNLKVYLDLVMTSTMLWIHKTSPEPLEKCAVLTILAWSFCYSLPDETRLGQHQSKQVDSCSPKVEQFLNLLNARAVASASGRDEDGRRDLDVGFVHIVAQWLCILSATIILHQVVENPPTKFSIHYFFTGSFLLLEIHFRLTLLPKNSTKDGFTSLSQVVAERLESMPNIKNVFEIFTAFLTSK